MAMQYLKLAKKNETESLHQAAVKNYTQASIKLMDLVKEEIDPLRKEVFKKHVNEALNGATFNK